MCLCDFWLFKVLPASRFRIIPRVMVEKSCGNHVAKRSANLTFLCFPGKYYPKKANKKNPEMEIYVVSKAENGLCSSLFAKPAFCMCNAFGKQKHRTSLIQTSVLSRQNLRTFTWRSPMFRIFRTVVSLLSEKKVSVKKLHFLHPYHKYPVFTGSFGCRIWCRIGFSGVGYLFFRAKRCEKNGK